MLLSGSSSQGENLCNVLLTAAWICGEYVEFVDDKQSLLESMLKLRLSIIPGTLLSAFLQNIMKLYTNLLLKFEADDDWDAIDSLDNLILSKLPEFQYSDHLEAQERACNFVQLIKFTETKHSGREKIGEQLSQLFVGELNPIAPKAQRKVPIPDGLNLDEMMNKSNLSTSDESSSHEEIENELPSIDMSEQSKLNSFVESQHESELAPKQSSSKHNRQQLERENNPYYIKVNRKSQPTTLPIKDFGGRSHRVTDSNDSPEHHLHNPLEIPGIVGLERWTVRESATINWKKIKNTKRVNENNDKSSDHEKCKKTTRKSGKRRVSRKQMDLSIFDSSGSESDHDKDSHISVNRDYGELPEGAFSSSEEQIEQIENDLFTLDISSSNHQNGVDHKNENYSPPLSERILELVDERTGTDREAKVVKKVQRRKAKKKLTEDIQPADVERSVDISHENKSSVQQMKRRPKITKNKKDYNII